MTEKHRIRRILLPAVLLAAGLECLARGGPVTMTSATPAATGPTSRRGAPGHALLKRDVGAWDATIQLATDPEGGLEVYNGTETNTLIDGGLWLLSDFKSRLGGVPFEGHGVLGYQPATQSFVRVWVDSTRSTPWPSEGKYDPQTDTLTLWMEAADTAGVIVRWKTVTAWKDESTRTFTMYVPGPEDTEAAAMTITYKRRR